ncbi:hypothetical protein CLV84_1455 [Neolewinella xylanilytica]|uniref:Uncharacterized protein n=2 Tax=Neolewinella xylanilytica TaxID=1514080 RepID=A0A2S6IAF5_9BACT|nr:hypothetical protein CLV84_1455 [Neolewinella xylanilytica]
MVCILQEVGAGWASLTADLVRNNFEAGTFLSEHWGRMQSIWGSALFGNVCLLVAALLLFKLRPRSRRLPESLIWAVYFLGNLCMVLSFSVSLGSYPGAFSVLGEQPYLFEAVRGIAVYLFQLGMVCSLSVFVVYFQEAFRTRGVVSRRQALIVLGLLVATLGLLIGGWLSFTVFALVCHLVPILLGVGYFRHEDSLL